MEYDNSDTPPDHYRNDIQQMEINLTDIRMEIDNGRYNLLPKYIRHLKYALKRMLVWAKDPEEITALIGEISRPLNIKESVNPMFSGSYVQQPDDYDAFLIKLDEVEYKLREIMKQNDFLTKVSKSRVRLT